MVVLIIFLVILQTDINVIMLSIGRQGADTFTCVGWQVTLCDQRSHTAGDAP